MVNEWSNENSVRRKCTYLELFLKEAKIKAKEKWRRKKQRKYRNMRIKYKRR